MSIGSCWFFGFILVIVIAACINPDLSSVMQSPFGQPMAQVSKPSKFPALVYLRGAINLTSLLDLLRRPRQERHPRNDVPPNDSAIPHGPLHPRSCQPAILGLLPRRRSPLLQILPPYLPEVRLYSSPHNLGLRRFSRCTGLVVIDRTGRCSGIVLACCGGE